MTETQPRQRSFQLLKGYSFFSYGSIAVLFVYFPLYFTEIGLTKLEVGMIMSGGPFISIFANPIWGYFSDKTQNIRRSIVILLLGSLLLIQLVVRVDTYGAILLAMLTFFFFQSPINSQSNSLILNAIEGSAHKFGSFRLWGSLGYAVTAVAVGPLVQWMELGRLWMIYSAFLLVAIVFTIGMPRGELQQHGYASNPGYRAVFRNPIFLLFIMLGVLISIPNAANNTFVSLYIQDLGGSTVAAGWASFSAAFFEVPIFIALDRIVRRETRYLLSSLLFVSILYMLRWILMSIAASPFHVMLIQAMHCITFGAYYYLGTILTSLLIPPQYRASGQAAFALTWAGISGIAAGLVGGSLYDAYGAVMMYRVNAVISFFGVLGYVALFVFAARSSKVGGEA